MTRREASALVWEAHQELMRTCIEKSFEFLPLPSPPLELPDFPAMVPKTAEGLIQQAMGIASVDRAGFMMRLEMVVEEELPDYVKRHIDSDREREKWLSENSEHVAERVLTLTIRDWLIPALDEYAPDTDRWYLASSTLIGLILNDSASLREYCFILFLSIAYARAPGSWPTMKPSGPHHIAWQPHQNQDAEETAHPSGILAANSILDILEMNYESASPLPSWLEHLSLREQLSTVLNVPVRLQNLLPGLRDEHSEPLVRSATNLLSNHPNQSKDILSAASTHESARCRRAIASSLQRIDSDNREFAITCMGILLKDEDQDCRVLATSYLGTLSRFELTEFKKHAQEIIAYNDERMIQRLVESGIRFYLAMDTADSGNIIPAAWISSNLSARSQLAGMLLELGRSDPNSLSSISKRIASISENAHKDLIERMRLRDQSIADLL